MFASRSWMSSISSKPAEKRYVHPFVQRVAGVKLLTYARPSPDRPEDTSWIYPHYVNHADADPVLGQDQVLGQGQVLVSPLSPIGPSV